MKDEPAATSRRDPVTQGLAAWHRPGRASAFARMVLTVSLVYALGVIATLGLVYLLMSRQIEALLADQIAGDIAQLVQIKGRDELLRVVDLRLQSEAREGGGTILLVETAEGANPLEAANLVVTRRHYGNIEGWPDALPPPPARARPVAPGPPAAPTLIDQDGRLLYLRGVAHPSGMRLVVGRDFARWSAFRSRLATTLLVLSGVAIAFGALGGMLVARGLLRRLTAINRFCAGIEERGLGGRLPMGRRGDEFDRLAHAINGMLDRIAELAQLNRTAAEQIAHDMRTPLTPVLSELERLGRPGADPPSPETLAGLHADLDRMRGMFDAVLEVSRIEAGGRRAEAEVDLAELAADTAEMYRPWAETLEHDIAETLAPAPMRGAPILLRQAVGNLLSNALRYQTEPGEIRLTTGRVDGRPFVEVADRGPGIPEAELPRVTQRLYRRAEHRHLDGHGMGLAFVAAIAQAHGMALELGP
ncbi:MAG: HAMP domain-containing sensor histidine kinase, partial [Pseudomonadota bacterium]